MGRPERPVDPDAGPLQRFAYELRSLRGNGGSPSYRTMAQRTGLSVTALSRAASGERLASAAVVRAYAQACGADPDEWERRRQAVAEEAGPQGAEEGNSPYQGLARFELGDRDLFFGRDRLVEDALKLVSAHRFAVLHGASGSGKSSLLRAGLLPRLDALIRERDRGMELRLITPGARPAATHERLLDAPPDGPERLVVVDQFEEIFTLCRDRADRRRFVDRLLAAGEPTSRLRVVVAVGGGFRARCAQYDGLAVALRHNSLAVRPMTRAELQEAVVKPATAAGLRVERELTARIVEEAVDRPGALPMLSQALRETWRRRSSGVLTLAAYEAAGGIHGAIAAAAEEVYGCLSPAQAATARRLLLGLVTPGEGSAVTRRPVSRADLREWPDPELPVVLDRLARARLVILDEEHIELAHEALITHWPRLDAWIEANRERLREHRRLSEAARIWQERDRDPGNLYRGTHLAVADLLFGRDTDDDLTGRERAFLSASRVADRMERWTAGRTRRRMRSLAVAFTVVVVGALVAGQLAWQRSHAADQEHIRAAALKAAALAARTQPDDPRTAALLSVTAWRLAPSPVSRAALISALTEPEEDVLTGPEPGAGGRAFLADSGRTLLVAGAGTWSSWNVPAHRRTGSGPLPDGQVAEADPAGRTLLLTGARRLWHLASGTGRPGASGRVLGFGADGHSYVVRDPGPRPGVRLSAADGGRTLFEAAGDAYPVPSPDDRLVAVCRPDGPLEVWDTARDLGRPGAWGTFRAAGCSSATVVFGAGGARLAVATDTGGVVVWDTATGRQLADLAGPAAQHLAFTPDGAFLAASGLDGVTVWRIAAPQLPVLRRPVPGSPVTALAWDPADRTLRYLAGSAVHSLDLGAALASPWRDRPVDAVLLSPDGRLLAVPERTPAGYLLRLQETRSARIVAELPFPRRATGPAVAARPLLAFSPDSRSIAYGTTVASGPLPTARFAVRDVSPTGRKSTSFDVTGPAEATARGIFLTARGQKLLVGWSTPAGSLVGQTWDTAHGIPSARAADLETLGRQPYHLALSADDTHLATGGAFGSVTVWDTEADIHPKATIPALPDIADCAACTRVTALAFSPDGTTLAIAYGSGALRLWDLALNLPLGGSPATSGDVIDSLAFGPDGYLYAAGPHVSVQAYPVGPAQAAARLCARAGRSLTVAEWRRYLPGVPYRRVCDGLRPDDGSP
ncbi:nSTAND1 domain-containing NTPase [Streptomyces acidiscabies]|uniref:nSTAND1 domain-containing NTPase n=1 Tax=Streptomyces acidiscabies TaxID=42234 RepID=UPI0009604475|nr:helix-turn-helix domain-containing protein [Streptomyces acidiscabies]GAV38960.1 WD domain, G-beta repeat [Streptomyces acidiscabies]